MQIAGEKMENCGWGLGELLDLEMVCLIQLLKTRVLIAMSSLQLQMLYQAIALFPFSTAQGTEMQLFLFSGES